MGGKNSGRQKKPALPVGSFRRLDGSIVQGGRVEKRKEHGRASTSCDVPVPVADDENVDVAQLHANQVTDQGEDDNDVTEIDATEAEDERKRLNQNTVAVRSTLATRTLEHTSDVDRVSSAEV